MRSPTLQIKDTILERIARLERDEIRSGILVPVNSSTNAFNALEYALNLARILNSTIHLFYVIDVDIDEVSDSPIVTHRILDRKYREAQTCVESLKEMIEESGVKVVTAESKIGNIGSLIQTQATSLRPGMIVIGRDCFTRSTINTQITYSTCPLIVVPESASPQLPCSIILTNEQDILSDKSLHPLIRIVQNTTQELTILGFGKFKKKPVEKIGINNGATNVMVNYRQIEHSPSAFTVHDFVRTNNVGLVCTIHQKQSLFKRFFRSDFSSEIVFSLEIPVMIMREAK
jgi:nucleotide-binding universal stress UspA family protein